MTDHPMLFSNPMVRALWDGRKTQTRRILPLQPSEDEIEGYRIGGAVCDPVAFPERPYVWLRGDDGSPVMPIINPPKVLPGDRLWVREAHWAWGHWELTGGKTKTGKPKWRFVRDSSKPVRFDPPQTPPPDRAHLGWHPRSGRFMFRQDSRMTLPVTDVRVQRLQDISEDDAIAEGIKEVSAEFPPCPEDGFEGAPFPSYADYGPKANGCFSGPGAPRLSFMKLWNSLNGPDAWDQNPWCSAYSFEVIKKNIDQIEGAS